MSTQVQHRRGTTAQHSTFTGAVGEVTVDTDKKTVVVHDGATAGGFALAREGGSVTFSSITVSGGTANGVPYLNGSKVLTTGSAITYNGTTFALSGEFSAANGAGGNASAKLASGNNSAVFDRTSAAGNAQFNYNGTQTGQVAALSGGGLEFYYGSSPTLGATLGASGDFAVGVAPTAGHRLKAKSSTADNTTFGTYISNSAGTVLFYARSDGAMATGIAAASPYNNTTASAANCVIEASAGVLQRSTSALKYKQDVRDLEDVDIKKFRPIRYKSKCQGDDQDRDYIGFIADWENEHSPDLVDKGADGEIENFQYARMTVTLTKALQQAVARIEALESKVL